MSDTMSSEQDQDHSNMRIETQKLHADRPNMFDPQILQAIDHAASVVMVLGMLAQEIKTPPVITTYDTKEDFDWYTSGQVDTKSFIGKYIAIWRKQIVGQAETALEVERIAKAYYGPDCRPAIIYVPKNEDAIL